MCSAWWGITANSPQGDKKDFLDGEEEEGDGGEAMGAHERTWHFPGLKLWGASGVKQSMER